MAAASSSFFSFRCVLKFTPKMNSTTMANLLAVKTSPSTQQFRLRSSDPTQFKPKKALVLTKVSRFEYEMKRHGELNERELEDTLSKRGSDLQMLKEYHSIHKKAENQLVQALERHGIETKVCQRTDYNDGLVQWADVIFSAGYNELFLKRA